MKTCFKLWCIGLLSSIFAVNAALDVSCSNVVTGPKSYGSQSHGYFYTAAGATLEKKCRDSADKACGNAILGLMSGIYLMDSSTTLILYPMASLETGNYTFYYLDKGCELTLHEQAVVRPNINNGGGRIEVYCSGTWDLGAGTYVNLDRQSTLKVEADFTVGTTGLIKMEPGSTLEVFDSLAMEDLVWLFLLKDSRMVINANSGSQASITASSLGGITLVQLEESATLIVNGTFTVGNGREVEMFIRPSGSLLIGSNGEFLVESTTFEVGPSSFWIIDGSFKLDKSSTFRTGMQSNFSLTGSIETVGGALTVAGFSSVQLDGVTTNQGNIQVSEFCTLVLGANSGGNDGVIQLTGGADLVLQELASCQIFGGLQAEAGGLTLDSSATALIESGAQLYLSEGGSVTLGSGADLNLVSNTFKSQGGSATLAPLAAVSVSGALSQSPSTSLTFGTGSVTTFSGNVQIQKGAFVVGEGCDVTVGGTYMQMGGITNFTLQSDVTSEGTVTMMQEAVLTVGSRAVLNIPASATIALSPKAHITVGNRATLNFCANVWCSVQSNFVVPDDTSLTACYECKDCTGLTCYNIG